MVQGQEIEGHDQRAYNKSLCLLCVCSGVSRKVSEALDHYDLATTRERAALLACTISCCLCAARASWQRAVKVFLHHENQYWTGFLQ